MHKNVYYTFNLKKNQSLKVTDKTRDVYDKQTNTMGV